MPSRRKPKKGNSTVRRARNVIQKTKSAIKKQISGFAHMLSPRKKTAKRKTAKKRTARPTINAKRAISTNRQAQWNVYRILERQITQAWTKLREDVKKGANPQILNRDKNNLLLLLGECNYMARECSRTQNRARR